MFLGMALFRLGFFTLKWSSRAYAATIAVGYLLAAPATAWLAWTIGESHFEPLTLNRLEAWQQVTRPLIGLAHASVLLLIVRAGAAQAVVNRLAAAGRMAFSNYLMTSIITTLVFCGFGFGLYGKLSRFEELAVVAGRLGLHPGLEQALAGALPLRALRMGLAFAGPLEPAAVRQGVVATAPAAARRPDPQKRTGFAGLKARDGTTSRARTEDL